MAKTTRIAVVQSRIDADIATNGTHIRAMLDRAAAAGASLALFPEGALSGYAKAQVKDWDALDWTTLAAEQALIRRHAEELGVIAVIGSATPVTGRRPHNSLHVLPTDIRYDKRLLSYSEITDWYTPGFEPVTFTQDGFPSASASASRCSFRSCLLAMRRLASTVSCMPPMAWAHLAT
jgi:predicted amidohydrolase